MQENRLSPALYGPKTALRPRLRTDRLFQLPGGSARFAGALADAIRFITKEQLMDTALWRLLANQFRSNVDDVDHGWRCEYWGKLMRGASFVLTPQNVRPCAKSRFSWRPAPAIEMSVQATSG